MERFAFIIHPIEIEDIYRKYNYLKVLPERMVEKIASYIAPSVVSRITNVKSQYSEAEGWFIAVPMTSRMMMQIREDQVLKKIIKAGKIAEKQGAKILGLGAYTSVVGDAGITIAKNLNIAVTTGNTYTVAAAFDATKEACKLLGKNFQDSLIAIVGANGSIGSVCAELACREGKTIRLVGRSSGKLQQLQKRLSKKYKNVKIDYSSNIEEGISSADVVITVTNNTEDVIKPEYIKTGAVICDVARPRDVSRRVQEERKDVLVIEGGVIEVPKGLQFNFNFGFPPGLCYACMAETMILALEKRCENFSLGREINIEKVDEINQLAKKHGFKLAGLRSFERTIDQRQIDNILRQIEKAEKV